QWHTRIGYRRQSREEQPAEYPNESRLFSSRMPRPRVTPAEAQRPRAAAPYGRGTRGRLLPRTWPFCASSTEASRGRLVSSSVIHFSDLSKPPCRRRRYTASLRLT